MGKYVVTIIFLFNIFNRHFSRKVEVATYTFPPKNGLPLAICYITLTSKAYLIIVAIPIQMWLCVLLIRELNPIK